MTAPVWLIAEREIRTYVATASFWVALAIGPIVAGGALLLSGDHIPPSNVTIQADDAQVAQSAKSALTEAAHFEGRHFAFVRDGATVRIANPAPGSVTLRFAEDFPLSSEGRALVARTLERDLVPDSHSAAPRVVDTTPEPKPVAKVNASALSGFILMMMLWLTLTGSLGMLLQSVVRERANRALESLLASATPRDIMIGKLIGVGAISFALLGAWLGSIVACSAMVSTGSGLAASVFASLANPLALVRAGFIYVLGYAFYGSLTITLGAIARDVAAAQNLSRPMFVVLLAAFFVSLFSASTGAMPHWLLLLPPFAPFLLLLETPDGIPFATEAASLSLLLFAGIFTARFAVSRLSIAPQTRGVFQSLRKTFLFGGAGA